MWLRRLLARLFKRRYTTIRIRVGPDESKMYQADARRDGSTLEQWARDRLNKGVSRETILYLSNGPYIPGTLPNARRMHMLDEPKISGHPCRLLDPRLPINLTPSECQGTCTSRKTGWAGKPCYWGPLAAKECDGFQQKIRPSL